MNSEEITRQITSSQDKIFQNVQWLAVSRMKLEDTRKDPTSQPEVIMATAQDMREAESKLSASVDEAVALLISITRNAQQDLEKMETLVGTLKDTATKDE